MEKQFLKIYTRWGVALACICSTASILLHASEGEADFYGSCWTDSLNFQITLPQGSNLQTGPQGNVTIFDEAVDFKQGNSKKFDLEAVHQQLQQHEKKIKPEGANPPNFIVAGVTVLMQFGDKVEAIFSLLKQGQNSLFFKSGLNQETNAPKGYTHYKPKERMASAFLTRLGTNLAKCHWITPTEQAYLFQKLGQWKEDEQEKISQVAGSICEIAKEAKTLDPLFQEIKKIENDANGIYYAAIDSEQYLLHHLDLHDKHSFVPEDSDPFSQLEMPPLQWQKYFQDTEGYYKDRKLYQFSEKLKSQLYDKKNKHFIDEAQAKEFFETYQSDVQKLKESYPVGYLFNLHSTYEICRVCSWSLADNILHSNLASILKKKEKPFTPFLYMTVSVSGKLESATQEGACQARDPNESMRCGVAEDKTREKLICEAYPVDIIYYLAINALGEPHPLDAFFLQTFFLQKMI